MSARLPRVLDRRFWLAPLAVLWFTAACAPPGSTPLTENHEAAVVDSVGDFLSGWADPPGEDEWGELLARYADDPDFLWVEDGGVRYRSVEAIRGALRSLEAGFTSETTEFTDPSITALAPGVAHVATRFETTLTRRDGQDLVYGGAMTMVVVHTDSGWKVLRGHTSSASRSR